MGKRSSFPPPSVCSPSEGSPPTTQPTKGGACGKLYWKPWKNPGRQHPPLTHINRGGYLGNLQAQFCSYVCREIRPLRQKYGVLPTIKKNNQNLNFWVQAAIPKHFQVNCNKKIIIFGAAGSEGQLIKTLASLQRSLKIQFICTIEVPTGGSIWGLGLPLFAVGESLLFHTAGTEIRLKIPMKTCFCGTGASSVLHGSFFQCPVKERS